MKNVTFLKKAGIAAVLLFSICVGAYAQNAPGGLPDNVSDADCFVNVPAQEWKIRELVTNSATNYNALQPVFVGDISGDGFSEIFVTSNVGSVSPMITTTYYVSVEGANYCENQSGDRKAVTVNVIPRATTDMIKFE